MNALGSTRASCFAVRSLVQPQLLNIFGNRTADDKSADVQAAGEQADLKCVQQVLG